MAKFRPIEREIFSDDIAAAYELAVHARVGFLAAPNRPSGPRMNIPSLTGVPVRGAVGGNSFSPANSPQSTATGGNQNPPFGSGN